MPLYGHELDDTTSPLEAGLGRYVKLARGGFIGAEAIARRRAAGPTRALVGFELLVPGDRPRRVPGGPGRPDRRPRDLGRALPHPREIDRAGLRSARAGRRGHGARDPDSGARVRARAW